MIESKDIAKRVVYYFKSAYRLGDDTINVDFRIPERVNYKDFSFIINLSRGHGIEDRLDVTIIPPKGSERDFETYLASLKNPLFYKRNLPENLRKKIKKHKKRMREANFILGEEIAGYHHTSDFFPTSDKLLYLEKLSLAVIDCVIRPTFFFGDNRRNK
jgi:hypothetical protein